MNPTPRTTPSKQPPTRSMRWVVIAAVSALFTAGLSSYAATRQKVAGGTDSSRVQVSGNMQTAPADAAAEDPHCVLPGVQIVTDPTGDASSPTDPAPSPNYDVNSQDVQAIYFAELAANPDKITYTMKVASLANLPMNGSWRIRFSAPDGVTYFVSMDTDESAAPTYSYGTYTVTGNQGNYTSQGSADAGSYTSDGFITITNSNVKTGSPKPGAVLGNIYGETSLLIGTSATGGLLATIDSTDNGTPATANANYTVVGNRFCGNPPVGNNRIATYTHGNMTFSANSPVRAPSASQDTEPSSRVDIHGNYYLMPIRGVPAGVDLFYFDLRPTINNQPNPNYDPTMRVPFYRGMVDSPSSTSDIDQLSAGALGGGDIDIAVGSGPFTGSAQSPQLAEPGLPAMAYASLAVSHVTVGNSLDRGKTFKFNPLGNFEGGVPVNDREWMGFIGTDRVYLVYRNFGRGLAFIQQSNDGGVNYGPALPPGGISFPQTGALDVDQSTGVVYVSSNDGHVAVGDPSLNPAPFNTPNDAPLAYTVHTAVPAGVDSANIFFPIRVATVNHTVYGVYSDGNDIYMVHSADKGVTWAPPVRVNDAADPRERKNLMPWLAVGPTPGSVGIAWYGTDNPANDDDARWRVFFAQTFNGDSNTPSFNIAEASDHSIHAANISLKGLPLIGVAPNRNLSDYFQINFDPQGAAVIGYTDDHIDFQGHSYVTRQLTGPSINGGTLPPVQEGSALPANPFPVPGALAADPSEAPPQPMQPGPNGEQVTDFAQDQASGLLAVAPTNSPADILSIKYLWQDSNAGPVITATMTVSDLTTVPAAGIWRMYFTANAPETGIVNIPGNSYSKGLSDDGDQFYVEARTAANGNRTAVWGTVVRNFDGSITRTQRGTADRAFFNSQSRSISVRISSSKLNTYLATLTGSHPPIGFGTVLCGLRGQTSVGNANALQDDTRGGTELVIANP